MESPSGPENRRNHTEFREDDEYREMLIATGMGMINAEIELSHELHRNGGDIPYRTIRTVDEARADQRATFHYIAANCLVDWAYTEAFEEADTRLDAITIAKMNLDDVTSRVWTQAEFLWHRFYNTPEYHIRATVPIHYIVRTARRIASEILTGEQNA